jgi:PAS fold
MSRESDGGGEALSSREQKLRLLVETIPALVWRTGPEGDVEYLAQLQATLNVLPAYAWYAAPSGALTFVNKRTADYLCIPKDHPLRFGIDIGARWDDWVPLLHPDDREEARKYWSNCLRTGKAGEHSYRVRSAHGDYRWFLARFEPLRASDGNPTPMGRRDTGCRRPQVRRASTAGGAREATPTRVRSRPHEPPKRGRRTGRLTGSRNRATDCYRAQQCPCGHALLGPKPTRSGPGQGSARLRRG